MADQAQSIPLGTQRSTLHGEDGKVKQSGGIEERRTQRGTRKGYQGIFQSSGGDTEKSQRGFCQSRKEVRVKKSEKGRGTEKWHIERQTNDWPSFGYTMA